MMIYDMDDLARALGNADEEENERPNWMAIPIGDFQVIEQAARDWLKLNSRPIPYYNEIFLSDDERDEETGCSFVRVAPEAYRQLCGLARTGIEVGNRGGKHAFTEVQLLGAIEGFQELRKRIRPAWMSSTKQETIIAALKACLAGRADES